MTQLLKDKSIEEFDSKTQDFLDSLQKNSTRNIYHSGLKIFQKFYRQEYNGTIEDFILRIDNDLQLSKGKREHVGRKSLAKFIVYMREPENFNGFIFSEKTISTYGNAVRSLVSYQFEHDYKIDIKGIGFNSKPKSRSEKYPWTLESFSEFITPMKPMYQALAACILMSGQGLEEILSLTYSDISSEYEQGIRPLRLEFKRKKTGVEYITFLGSSALDLLDNYFKLEGKLKPEDNIFPVEKETIERYFSRRAIRFLRKESVSVDTKPWVGNNPMRPHSLRSAFNKLLIKGGCPNVFIEYWMGHCIDQLKDAYVVASMSELEWRSEYVKFEPLLSFKL